MKKPAIIIKHAALFILALFILNIKVNALELRTLYGSTTTCNYIIRDIFVVWWDKNYDYKEGATNVLNSLVETRKDCLETFEMKDPKGSDKYYYNVYIHNNGPDLFPDRWAQGQGTDADGYPYLTIPFKLTSPDYHGHVHEGFHIFQYNANSPGFKYKGDSQWFIEATFDNKGTEGAWFKVPAPETPAAWAYNVYEINNSITGSYTLSMEGDEYGSKGTPSRFTVRAAVSKPDSTNIFCSMDLKNDLNGKLNLKVTPENSKIRIVIVSTPDHFTSNQTYPYKIKIDAVK